MCNNNSLSGIDSLAPSVADEAPSPYGAIWRPNMANRVPLQTTTKGRFNASRGPEHCSPGLTECPRCRNTITYCDGIFAPTNIDSSTLEKRELN